jgi:hypothetical protein
MKSQTIVIRNVDLTMLKKQKAILINMIQDWGDADDAQQRKDAEEAEGLVSLISAMQDYAVYQLGLDEKKVFKFAG